MTIHENEALDITCQADANPPAHEYRWRKDGRELKQETAQLLTIPAAQPEDMARYTCEAVNVLKPTGQEYPQHATGSATVKVNVECELLFKKICGTFVLFMFWAPGDVCPGFQTSWIPCLHVLKPACNGFLRFTYSATLADL